MQTPKNGIDKNSQSTKTKIEVLRTPKSFNKLSPLPKCNQSKVDNEIKDKSRNMPSCRSKINYSNEIRQNNEPRQELSQYHVIKRQVTPNASKNLTYSPLSSSNRSMFNIKLKPKNRRNLVFQKRTENVPMSTSFLGKLRRSNKHENSTGKSESHSFQRVKLNDIKSNILGKLKRLN